MTAPLPEEIAALLAPVPETDGAPGGAGVSLRYDPAMVAIRQAREEDDASLPLGDWARPLKRADWPAVALQCSQLLRERSKDLQLAAWLLEAWVHLHQIDGLRAGVITPAQLCEVALFARHYEAVIQRYPDITIRKLIHEVIRRMINEVATDLIDTTRARLHEYKISDVDAVRSAGQRLVSFSERVLQEHQQLKKFLREHVYQNYRVVRMTNKSQRVVRELFSAYSQDVRLLPDEHRQTAGMLETKAGLAGRARAVADYIAGMTDRYAILEHTRLYDPRVPQG